MKRIIAGFTIILATAGSFDASLAAGVRFEWPVAAVLIAIGLIATGTVAKLKEDRDVSDGE